MANYCILISKMQFIKVICNHRRAGRPQVAGVVATPSPALYLKAMLDDIYNRKILELAANIPRLGRLAAPQASASAHSRLCGSSVTIDLALADGRVADFAQ